MEIDGRAMRVWLLYPTWADAWGLLGFFAWRNLARLPTFDSRMNPSPLNALYLNAHSQLEGNEYDARRC